MNQHVELFVEFYTSGAIVADTWTKPVTTRDPNEIPWPDEAYAFCLYERTVAIVDGQTLRGRRRQIGPMYYHPDSRVETLKEARRNPKSSAILIRNMECNRWNQIIWSRWGNWPQPFDERKAMILRQPVKPAAEEVV